MSEPISNDRVAELEKALARLERRLGKVEMVLRMGDEEAVSSQAAAKPIRSKSEIEMAVGQHLFAKVGIVVLATSGLLTLSLPWSGLPALVPSMVAWLLVVLLFVVAQLLQKSMPMNARYFRGSGMALLFFATLRLSFFIDPPLLAVGSVASALALSGAVAANLGIAWWRKSVFLTGLAMLTGYIAALAVGTPAYVLGMVTALLLWAGLMSRRHDWVWLPVFAIPLTYGVYLIWALGNPVLGHAVAVAQSPVAALGVLLLWILIHGLLMVFRKSQSEDAIELQVGSLFNCGAYLLFLLHSLIGFERFFVVANIVVSLVLLALAVMFWVRERSQFATFLYAMTGYGALTVSLIKASEVPELFVWLSAQSLLVVVTALWFRSRFIIVANFLIYLAVITGYMVLVEDETGISLVFVWVALTSARILKWKKDRLELKTELMRNAYLTSAFVVFPYALYHIVPSDWVAASWVGIALFYYGMTMVTRARKYRWMGHNTLLLTVIYIVVVGIGKMEGAQRIVSFLLLGTVLLVVSIVFSVIHARQHRNGKAGGESDNPKS